MVKIETSGSPGQRGRAQGRACPESSLSWLYRIAGSLKSRPMQAATAAAADSYRREMAALYPEGYEECTGLAEALNLKEGDYFKAVLSLWLINGSSSCTVLGLRDGSGHPLLGKTDDIYRHELGSNVLEETSPGKGYGHWHFHFAGTIWTVAGINEKGLAIAMTGVAGPRAEGPGLSSLDALHSVLPSCASVSEAVELIEGTPLKYGGFSLLLADSSGMMTLVEKTSAATVEIPPVKNGWFLHTNHILDPERASLNCLQDRRVMANGLRRYRNALKIIERIRPEPGGMISFLRNRNPAGPVFQRGEDSMYTDFAVVLKPSEISGEYLSYPDFEKLERFQARPPGSI